MYDHELMDDPAVSKETLNEEVMSTPFADATIAGLPGPGWFPLLIALHRQLSAIDPNYRVEQVKEKFGLLRVYCVFEEDAERCEDLIWQAEQASAHICEECGDSARLRRDQWWMRTLCDACAARREARRELARRSPTP